MIAKIDFSPGDTVRVYQKIQEGDPSAHSASFDSAQDKGSGQASSGQVKSRTQVFEGVVLAIKGRGENKTFMARKQIGDVAVERIWPINSPSIEKVVVKARPKKRIRRAKLYYLRKSKQ